MALTKIEVSSISDDAISTAKIANSAISTAKIADDAITLAKLAAGTDGELITWDAAGNPAAVAVGTSTHVLTSNGTGAAPTFQAAAGGGAWKLIGTAVASGSANLTITGISSTYDSYFIALSDIRPASTSTPLLRMGDSGGIDTTGYMWGVQQSEYNNAAYNSTQGTGTAITLSNVNTGTGTGDGFVASIWLQRPTDGTTAPMVHWQYQTYVGGGGRGWTGMGARTSVISLDRLQFLMTSGNITSGRMTVWGIAHE